MLKNVVLSFILIFLIFTISFAQVETYELEGWVKYQNNEPASGVTMSIGRYYIETDQNGYYRFTLLWPGWQGETVEPGEHVISIGPPDRSIRSVRVIIKRNHPYQIDNNLNIRNIEGGQLLDNSRSSIAITSEGNNLYQMRRGGTILRYTGRGWEQLDNTPDNYGILFHNEFLYKILQNGEIWQYTGTAWEPTWERLEHDPTTYAFFTNFIPERNIVIVRKDFLINW
jgi:hypothetical protein